MEGRLLKVRVSAGAKKEAVMETGKGLRISVREKAEAGAANARVRELVALHLGVPMGKVHLKSGHHSPSKLFLIG